MAVMDGASLFAAGETFVPRFRQLGDLTLDLFHHDGRVEDCWLGLDPPEFALLWRLAAAPQRRLPDDVLMAWAREQASAELAARRLHAKLAAHRLGPMLTRHLGGLSGFPPPIGPRRMV